MSDPRGARNFTLNQFNLVYDATGEGVDLCQVHFYDYNPAFLGSLPGALRQPQADTILAALLRRVSAGLGYLPGWASPRVRVVARRGGQARNSPLWRSSATGRTGGHPCCMTWYAPC